MQTGEKMSFLTSLLFSTSHLPLKISILPHQVLFNIQNVFNVFIEQQCVCLCVSIALTQGIIHTFGQCICSAPHSDLEHNFSMNRWAGVLVTWKRALADNNAASIAMFHL